VSVLLAVTLPVAKDNADTVGQKAESLICAAIALFLPDIGCTTKVAAAGPAGTTPPGTTPPFNPDAPPPVNRFVDDQPKAVDRPQADGMLLAQVQARQFPRGRLQRSNDPNCPGSNGELYRSSKSRYPGTNSPAYEGVNRVYLTGCLGRATISGLRGNADRQGQYCAIAGSVAGFAGAVATVTGLATFVPGVGAASGAVSLGSALVSAGALGYSVFCNGQVDKVRNIANALDVAQSYCGRRGIAYDLKYSAVANRESGRESRDLYQISVGNFWCQADGTTPARQVPKGPF